MGYYFARVLDIILVLFFLVGFPIITYGFLRTITDTVAEDDRKQRTGNAALCAGDTVDNGIFDPKNPGKLTPLFQFELIIFSILYPITIAILLISAAVLVIKDSLTKR